LKRRKLLIALFVLLLAVGIVGWRLYVLRERALLSRPLIAAVNAGDIAQAKSLLDRGADPNSRATPDVPVGIFDFLKDLLDRKRHAERENYPTALFLVIADQGDIVYELKIRGGDKSHSRIEMAKLLLERGKQTQPPLNLNAQDEAGQTALMIASYNGDTPIVRLLLRHGADPRLRDRENFTALRYAADSPDIASLLRASSRR
jgi:ankyrin repeat protein